ncbi:hypothetical protein PAMC26510_16915 [Caballeronia sordidicola]|uniref:Uncharacterized protein n=1 Tax=Caballeronia sordidicola TaxID=196367 RepID=A0A242MGT5_CABSO|nr:hypothetical protein PAMC26577_28045 [Caballeronia sordidicola]OTP74387.1 hypothetical protein PAMC26510_16915 [Caballeronia sordidicola]
MTAGSTKTAKEKSGEVQDGTRNAKSHGCPWLHGGEMCAGLKSSANP